MLVTVIFIYRICGNYFLLSVLGVTIVIAIFFRLRVYFVIFIGLVVEGCILIGIHCMVQF
jgi:hypothetical protein